MIYVFSAFYGECSELIKHYNLKKRQPDSRLKFDVFESDDIKIKVIITGTGAVMAAACVSSIATYFGIEPYDVIINVGTCAGQNEAGHIFVCNKITEAVTGRTFYPDMVVKCDIAEAEIVSEAVPVDAYKLQEDCSPKLYDMEATAIYQAANMYVGPHRMGFVKVVSDNGDISKLTPEHVKQLMAEATPYIVNYIDRFLAQNNIGVTGNSHEEDVLFVQKLCKDLHCSKTMENQVVQLIKYLKLEGCDYKSYINSLYEMEKLPAHDKKNGKVCLDEIKRELL